MVEKNKGDESVMSTKETSLRAEFVWMIEIMTFLAQVSDLMPSVTKFCKVGMLKISDGKAQVRDLRQRAIRHVDEGYIS